jgi:predicted peptidase
MSVLLVATISCSSVSLASPASTVGTTPDEGFITRIFTGSSGTQMTYYLYIPAHLDPQKKYPLVLLLHGGGERAQVSNTSIQNRDVLLNQAYVKVWSSPKVQDHWPSFIVVPQVVYPQRWVNVPAQQGSYTLAARPTASLLMAKEIVDELQKQYTTIDPNRLYVTGLSMGGYGTWEAIERWPNYFAAAAPIAGAGDPSKASVLIHLPIWAFHGSADTTVPVSGSRDMINAIRAAGGNSRYTEFPGAGHGVWGYVYSLGASNSVPGFFPWLFSQHK